MQPLALGGDVRPGVVSGGASATPAATAISGVAQINVNCLCFKFEKLLGCRVVVLKHIHIWLLQAGCGSSLLLGPLDRSVDYLSRKEVARLRAVDGITQSSAKTARTGRDIRVASLSGLTLRSPLDQ